jgi:hypothetical protein
MPDVNAEPSEQQRTVVGRGEAGRVRLEPEDLPVALPPAEEAAPSVWTPLTALFGVAILGVMVALLIFLLWGVFHVIPS